MGIIPYTKAIEELMEAREELEKFAKLWGWNKNKLIGWSEAADFAESYAKQSQSEEVDKSKVTRVEVINYLSDIPREYVKYFKEPIKIEEEIQDDGRTLKIFIQTKPQ